MSSHCREAMVAAALLIVSWHSTAGALVVCTDPDHLPYSRKDGTGVENRIVQLVADEMGAQLPYCALADRHRDRETQFDVPTVELR
jgi:mxaJ protein